MPRLNYCEQMCNKQKRDACKVCGTTSEVCPDFLRNLKRDWGYRRSKVIRAIERVMDERHFCDNDSHPHAVQQMEPAVLKAAGLMCIEGGDSGCHEPVRARGYCMTHYQQHYRKGGDLREVVGKPTKSQEANV